jgi:ABC-type amino acid transport substrate-binding protein
MSVKSPDRNTRAKSKPAFLRLGRHLYWILPISIATVAVTAVLLIHSTSGSDIAGSLALSVSVIGAIAAILAIPGLLPDGKSVTRQKRAPDARISIPLVLLMATLAAIGSGVIAAFATNRPAPTPAPPAASAFLAGDLKIGIAGEVPGWSTNTGDPRGLDGYSGFEIDLLKFLRQKYEFKPALIPLAPEEQYDSLLRGDVDLIVANFEITSSRNDSVFFAGPYFSDRYGLYVSRKKVSKRGQGLVLCRALSGEKSSEDSKFRELEVHPSPVVEYADSNQSCVTRFLDPANKVNSLAMNQSILLSLLVSRNFDAKNLELRSLGTNISYGIGFRRKDSAACRAVAADLDLWLNQNWTDSVRTNLPFLFESPETLQALGFDPRPHYSNPATCAH